jgi:hypothetical protein
MAVEKGGACIAIVIATAMESTNSEEKNADIIP